jgi:asparagine synthase (glutamine-hydrolysing)
MCGFAGVYEYATLEGRVSEALITAMRDTLRHRGPDGAGSFVSEDARVGLGHRRLAVVDIAGGAQPMFGRRGECLVYNGEIYNYPRLREELEASGTRFESNCDTEVVVRLYERHGAGCLRFLEGMFAFALWDPVRDALLLARDRVGEKPLYFSDGGGRLVFGSEVKAVLAHPAIDAELDRDALHSYLTHLVAPAPRTLFRGISKLAPGEMAICTRNGMRVSRWWEGTTTRRWAETSAGEAATKVRGLLERSVHKRLMSDVTLGVLLSGGLDSSALIGLLGERARGMATFSVGFDGEGAFDERAHARRAARHFGTDHHEVCVGERDALEVLPRLIRHQDEPLADPVCVPLYFVCEAAAREGVKVVLGGEGSDELFWGYPRYQKIVRWWPALRVARAAPRAFWRAGARTISPRRHALVRDFAEGLACQRQPPMHMPAGVPRHQRELLLRGGADERAWSARSTDEDGSRPLDTLAFDTQEYEFGVRLPERLLMRLDRFSMANGVEARVPFLDHELVEYVYRLPPALKIAGGETKLILRRAVADVVPAWVMQRRKQGFEAPVASWFDRRMGELLRSLTHEDALRSCFHARGLEALSGRDRPGSGASLARWPVLNFALWHIAWIEGRDLQTVLEPVLASS